ncbi:MAG: hypothetical protein B7Y65_03020 [Azorhizobium sp. 35-67-15]|jgi:hypothetical protein|uniref:hypothetical protein n=1 Tax=Roseixanthobacter glucoisosaccharinicivorans TaxID=3119923 RepID=UPI000BC3CA33|nr:MAG: hypothetical protein B7Y65_03020 [Azorhizobium sp. 35-67-15]OZA84736.1 MAG: hypothetical protein B7X76_06250 [Azorhizobium sp. 39-67-5]
MNRIVREHYPVEKLPEDLRVTGNDNTDVRVVIERVPASVPEEKLRALLALARRVEPIGDDSVERIRKLRDEWDD